MHSDVITLRNVTKYFNKGESSFKTSTNVSNRLTALNDISFTISEGEAVGIIGLNGSGKTTLLRIISGIYKPNLGTIQITGKIATILQIGTGFRNELNAKENIVMYGMLLGLPRSEIKSRIDSILKFAELEEFKDMKLKHYSAGMRTRLAFTTAMQVNPDILLIDEALAVGDIAFKEKSFKELLEFKRRRKTILFATHSLNTLSTLADRVILLHHGNMIGIGSPNDIIERYKEVIKNNISA